jgi:hypothetical protein
MRIGATMGTMLPALAQAVVFHRSLPSDLPVDKAQASLKAKLQEAASAVVEAYNFLPNLVCDRMHDTTYIFVLQSFIELWICREISTNFAQ